MHSFGIISFEQQSRFLEMNRECQRLLDSGNLNNRVCFSLLDDAIDSSGLAGKSKVVMYDIRQFSASSGTFPPGHNEVEAYLNRVDVRRALHVQLDPAKLRFAECADAPYEALAHQDGLGISRELEKVLDYHRHDEYRSKIRVLVFSGQYDIICNHLGSSKVLRSLNWTRHAEWRTAPTGIYTVDGRVAGYVKREDNLASLIGECVLYIIHCDSSC